ncbi:flagellar export chaperone FlgN [Sulfurivirga sp.]|uniref:flagellar export chaperone FlgN n=1 Tax=Sulfurivirga sp. TaxID=2614236 RepID=UPI0025E803C3|nr:flagellar export chaperone FlgN [Sulfurivirga sp.]
MEQLLPLLEQFLYLLQEEKALLNIHPLDTDALNALTERKQQLLDQLTPLSEALKDALPEEAGSLTTLLKELEGTPQADRLRQFISLSEQAERLHLENGATLMRLAQLNEGVLRLLLGRPEDAPTYGPTGGGSRRSGGNKLGEA